jgi:hypothetical protein
VDTQNWSLINQLLSYNRGGYESTVALASVSKAHRAAYIEHPCTKSFGTRVSSGGQIVFKRLLESAKSTVPVRIEPRDLFNMIDDMDNKWSKSCLNTIRIDEVYGAVPRGGGPPVVMKDVVDQLIDRTSLVGSISKITLFASPEWLAWVEHEQAQRSIIIDLDSPTQAAAPNPPQMPTNTEDHAPELSVESLHALLAVPLLQSVRLVGFKLPSVTKVTLDGKVNQVAIEHSPGASEGVTVTYKGGTRSPLPTLMMRGCHTSTLDLHPPLMHIQKYAHANCPNLEVVKLPNTLRSIGMRAFLDCSLLIQLDASVTSIVKISEAAFSRCYSLASIRFPASLKTIEKYAFFKCTSLTELTFPTLLNEIGYMAFAHCDRLRLLRFNPADILNVNKLAFSQSPKRNPVNNVPDDGGGHMEVHVKLVYPQGGWNEPRFNFSPDGDDPIRVTTTESRA